MLYIDVSSDIDKAISEVGEFFRGQIPFATSVALNNAAFDIRHVIVNETWQRSFKVRNTALPRRLFQVSKKARKNDLMAHIGQTLDREFVQRQAMGGVKTGRAGGRVAIPAKPETMRTKTGRIRAPLKPQRLKGGKGVFSIQKGNKTFVLRRKTTGKKANRGNTLLYSVVPSANISKAFRFYEDAEATAIRVFPGYWNLSMNAAIATSRFKGR